MVSRREDKKLIGYCGLYCGDCHAYTGVIPDLARDLRKELRKSKYDKFARFLSEFSSGEKFKHFEECYSVLGEMIKFRCKKGCRNGGGSPYCRIRKCSQDRGLEGCWECAEFGECEELHSLNPIHGRAHLKNLRSIKKKGKEGFLKGKRLWYS